LFQDPAALAAVALVLALLPSAGLAQMPGPTLPQIRVEQTEHGMRANVGGEMVDISVCRDSVIHVVTSPNEPLTAQQPRPWMLSPQEACQGASFHFAQNKTDATLTIQDLRVEFSLSGGNLTFTTAEGQQLLQEWGAVRRTYEPTVANGMKTYRIEDRFSMGPMEAVYGLGQHQNGMFNYRGATVELAQNNTAVAIPLLLSTKGYALMWNIAAYSHFDNRFPSQLDLRSVAGDSIDYYFMYGPEMDQIIHLYRSMTGHTPMLPKWAYGFFQSKDRYVSLDQIEQIAARYRSEHIPLDAMVQDWFWWKNQGDPVFNSN
jgi:alpha-D-xyloside xylohydrolase